MTSTWWLTVGEDNIVGTAGNDTISAPIVQNNTGLTVETLESIDVIDGGAGTDTLNVTLAGGAPAAMISNVEIINVRATGASTIDLANVTGVEQVWNRGSNDVALTIGNASSTDITFGVANTAADSVIVFADDAVDGTADELKLVLSSASDAVISADDASANGNVIEAVSLTVTGDNVADIMGVGNAVETLTITGTGSVDLTVNATALATLDASAMTEALDIDISAASSTALNVETGAGDDRVVIDGDLLLAANEDIVVALGAGTNTLALTNIDDEGAIGTLVFDAATLTDVDAVELVDAISIGASATIDFEGVAPSTLVFGGAIDGDTSTLSLDNTATTLDTTFEAALGLTGEALTVDFLTAEVLTINTEDDVLGTTLVGNEVTSLTVNATESATTFGDAAVAGDEVTILGQGDADLDTLTSITLSDTSEDGDVAFVVILDDTTNVSTIALSGGEATDFTLDVRLADFDGAVTINIGDFGVDADGVTTGGLSYTSDNTNGVRETFKFVGTNIGDITIEAGSFLAGIGATADRLDFSQIAGIDALDDLSIELLGGNTVITAADGQFDGTIIVTGVDLTTDAVNFIL